MTTTEYNSAVAYFLSFCVEIYKKAHSISGKAALDRLMKSGAMQFLETNYGSIHTQSPQWILEEIDEYVKCHSGN